MIIMLFPFLDSNVKLVFDEILEYLILKHNHCHLSYNRKNIPILIMTKSLRSIELS